jgi:hypothetical protein
MAAADEPGDELRETPCIGVRMQNGARGAEVVEVFPGFPADGGDIRVGDEIVFVDGVRVYGSEDFINRIQTHYRIGDRIDVVTLRNGERQVKSLLLDRYPDPGELFARRLLGRSAPELPNLLPGRVSLVIFVGHRNREFGCDALCRALTDEIARLAAKNLRGLRLFLVGGTDNPRAQKGILGIRDPHGIWHDAFHVADEPALVIVDRDGWVRFAETGGGLSLAGARPALDRALESQNGLRI